MPNAALYIGTAQGEKKIATFVENDPVFGEVHLFRVSGGSGGGSSGGLTDLELRASPVSVDVFDWPSAFGSVQSGAWSVGVNNFPASFQVSNFPATQPVSGSVAVSNFPASQPVTGTFWQPTQPVSGTFWQATQPVSGPLTNAELRASAVPVTMSAGGAWTVNSSNALAPAANAVLSDTGALPAGTYEFMFEIAYFEVAAAGKGLIVEHRNAANSATLNTLGGVNAPGAITWSTKLTLALNERVRVINGSVAGAATARQITAIYRRAA